jgi:hypothetical protein
MKAKLSRIFYSKQEATGTFACRAVGLAKAGRKPAFQQTPGVCGVRRISVIAAALSDSLTFPRLCVE